PPRPAAYARRVCPSAPTLERKSPRPSRSPLTHLESLRHRICIVFSPEPSGRDLSHVSSGMVRGKVGAMLDTALANNLDRIRMPRVHLSDVARHATRGAAILIVFVCAILQNDSLPAVLQQLGTPFPVQITSKTSVAAIGIHEDGRLTIYFAPRLASSSDSDMLAFLYLHELGHARLGHMRPEDPRRLRFSIPGMYKGLAWQMEYEADALICPFIEHDRDTAHRVVSAWRARWNDRECLVQIRRSQGLPRPARFHRRFATG